MSIKTTKKEVTLEISESDAYALFEMCLFIKKCESSPNLCISNLIKASEDSWKSILCLAEEIDGLN